MLKLNKKMEYGVLALLYLGTKEESKATVREIASHCHIPENILSKIMQHMKHKSLVTVSYGNQGGYRLMKPLSQINLWDMSTLFVGESMHLAECLDEKNNHCACFTNCALQSTVRLLNHKIRELFQNIYLESIHTKGCAL